MFPLSPLMAQTRAIVSLSFRSASASVCCASKNPDNLLPDPVADSHPRSFQTSQDPNNLKKDMLNYLIVFCYHLVTNKHPMWPTIELK